jgi:uncharacterized protein
MAWLPLSVREGYSPAADTLMPRRLLKKVLPDRHKLSQRWFMRPFALALRDPVYWTVHRRAVLRAVALGLFISFIPVPVHLVIAPVAALLLRANMPVTILALLASNPLTYVPMFYGAYWVGIQVLGAPAEPFAFAPTWEWVQTQLVRVWKPLAVGCLICGSAAAALGYWSLALLWRVRAVNRYQQRGWRLRRRTRGNDENAPL